MDDLAGYAAIVRPDSDVIYTDLSVGRRICLFNILTNRE
jgi:hypothetical protein